MVTASPSSSLKGQAKVDQKAEKERRTEEKRKGK
jgi:hypothetical protein